MNHPVTAWVRATLSFAFVSLVGFIGFIGSGCRTLDTNHAGLKLAAGGGQRHFFHWGSEKANADILAASGYNFHNQSHTSDLADNKGWVNDAVFDLVHKWYLPPIGGRSDAAGSGIYVSEQADDTKNYGSDLLIFEVRGREDESFTVTNVPESDFKMRSDKALDNHDFSTLPFMASYFTNRDNTRWSVITRPPTGQEGYTIRVGPPSAEDVDAVWLELAGNNTENSPRKAFDALNYWANLLTNNPPSNLTRSSEIFFQRLVFDRGSDFFSKIASQGELRGEYYVMALPVLALYKRVLASSDPRLILLKKMMND